MSYVHVLLKIKVNKHYLEHFINFDKIILISPNFLVWRFFPKDTVSAYFERFIQTYAEIMLFHKISTEIR